MEFYVQVAERDPVGYTGSETINALRFKVKEAEALPIGIGRLKFYTRRGEREALPPSTRLTELPPGTGTVTNPLHVPYDEEARPAAEVMGLESADDFVYMRMRAKFRLHTIFNRKQKGTTDKIPEDVSNILKVFRQCEVCGRPSTWRDKDDGSGRYEVPITSAHILKNQTNAAALKVPFDKTNFLRLCGTEGMADTCHDDFDAKRMAFTHVDKNKWVVIGGGKRKHHDGGLLHGRQVTFVTCPHRRSLYHHLANAVLSESLQEHVPDSETCITCDEVDVLEQTGEEDEDARSSAVTVGSAELSADSAPFVPGRGFM